MNDLFEDAVDCKRILREIYLLRMVKHENLIKIIEVIMPSDPSTFDHIYVVTDYCQSDLKKLFKSPIHLNFIHIQTLTYNIICALKYLHSAEVLHRDLKPEDIMLDGQFNVKIADFGSSAPVEGKTGTGYLHTYLGTKNYMAPEIHALRNDNN